MKHPHLQSLPIIAALLGIALLTPVVSSAEEIDLPPVMPTEEHVIQGNVSIETKPDKLLYRVGEKIDLTGLTLVTSMCVDGALSREQHGQTLADNKTLSVLLPATAKPGVKKVSVSYTPESEEYTVYPGFSNFEIIVTDVGDTDVNGILDTDDLILMNSVLQGKTPLSGDAAVNADMNGDGEIDVFDLALMKRNLHTNVPEYMTLTPTVRMDTTRDADKAMWEIAYSEQNTGIKAFYAASTLKVAARHLPAAVSRSLLKTYDDAFFEHNVLFLHYDIYDGGSEIQEFSDIAYKDGQLTITTKPKQTKESREALMLWQIALPREQFNGSTAVWTEQDAAYFKAGYSVSQLLEFNEEARETLWEGVLVTNAEEELALQELLYQDKDRKGFPSGIPNDDYQKSARFYRIISVGIGSERKLWQTRRVGDRIIAELKCTAATAVTCEPVWGLEVLTIPADYAAGKPSVEVRTCYGGAYFDTDGESCCFRNTLPDVPDLVVNSYHFGNEYEIAFYWQVYGSSITPDHKLIKSEAVSADASRFHDRDSKNGQILKDDAEGFSIEWGDTGVTVTFMKSKATGKPTLLHFPYPQP